MSKPASRRTSGSDLSRVDAHKIKPHEYKELPELTDAMLARAVVNKGGRPKSENPRQLISLRLPPEVVARWRGYGLLYPTPLQLWRERLLWAAFFSIACLVLGYATAAFV